jgi:hypothetical protein
MDTNTWESEGLKQAREWQDRQIAARGLKPFAAPAPLTAAQLALCTESPESKAGFDQGRDWQNRQLHARGLQPL